MKGVVNAVVLNSWRKYGMEIEHLPHHPTCSYLGNNLDFRTLVACAVFERMANFPVSMFIPT